MSSARPGEGFAAAPALAPGRRRAVAAAVRRGQVVHTPEEAYAAVEQAQRIQRAAAGRLRTRSLLGHLVVALVAAGAVLHDLHDAWPAALLLVLAPGPLALALLALHRRSAAAEAERLNRQLLEAYGLPTPPAFQVRPPADRRLVLALSLTPMHVAILTAALLVTGAAGSDAHPTHGKLVVLAVFALGGLALAGAQVLLVRMSLRDPKRLPRPPRVAVGLVAAACAGFWIVETAIVFARNW